MKTLLAFFVLFYLSQVTFAQAGPVTSYPSGKKKMPATAQSKSTGPASDSKVEQAIKRAPGMKKESDPDEIVMTIPGICPPGTPPESCGTKVSRADFEQVLGTLNQTVLPEARRQVAESYAQVLVMATAARQAGVDKDPGFQEKLKLQRLTLLAQGLHRQMQETSKPTAQEIENFYTENSAKFEELSLHRIMIPKGEAATPADAKQLAQSIRDRAAKGEDPDKLEAGAYQQLKIKAVPPSTDLGWKRRDLIDPRHEPAVVALHAGEVSETLEDGQAFYIYKVDSKRLIPLASVEKDLTRALQGQKAQAKLKALLDGLKPQLNEAYFGPAPSAPASPAAKP